MNPITDTDTDNINVQLPLGLSLSDSARFESFYSGPNREVKQALRRCAEGGEQGSVFIWGARGTGKTHLLQAVCREAGERGQTVGYLPLDRNGEFSPELLEGLESLAVVCVDDIQAIAGLREWEEAVFHLFNRLQQRGVVFIAAADCPPSDLGVKLDDLASRLGWGLVYPIRPVDDQARLELLQLRAQERGLDLPEETGRFLLSRYPRDLPTLCELLDRLDHASLVAQRRLTIPFIKTVLDKQ